MKENGGNCRVLLVEDDPVFAATAVKRLALEGFQGEWAVSGEEAIQRLGEGATVPDAVVMDLGLGPGMDGAEAARTILAKFSLPVVFLSGHSSPEMVSRVRDVAHYGYVVKGQDLAVLVAVLESAIALFRARAETEAKARELARVNADLASAKRELESERRLLDSIMKTSPVGITMVDSRGDIAFANPRAEEVLGLSRADITSRTYDAPAWDITDAEGNPFPPDALPFSVVRRTGKSVYGVRHSIGKPDGSRVVLSINASPLMLDGAFGGMVASIEDITERMRVETDLRERTKELRCFTAVSEILDSAKSLRAGLPGIADAIARAMKRSESACVKIRVRADECATKGFVATPWRLTVPITGAGTGGDTVAIGEISVHYRSGPSGADADCFLREERALVACIAEKIGRLVSDVRGTG